MKGDESPQDDEVACSSIVWVLAYYLEKKNLTRKLKIYGPKINRSRKAAGGLARRTRSRHWLVTLEFL